MGAVRWQPWEVAYLRDHAEEGAEAIAARLGKTVRAVEVKASREGVALRRIWQCPRCGRGTYLPPSKWSGWCRRCSVEAGIDKAREARRRAMLERAAEERAIRSKERERQALYTRLHRARKSCGDSVENEK